MNYYKIEAKITNEEWVNENWVAADHDIKSETTDEIRMISDQFNSGNVNECKVFISQFNKDDVTIGIITETEADIEEIIETYSQKLNIPVKVRSRDEIVFRDFRVLAFRSSRKSFIEDLNQVLPEMPKGDFPFGENFIEEEQCNDWEKETGTFMSFTNLSEEMERIKQGDGVHHVGHPVHYIIRCDDHDNRNKVYKLLLSTLYGKKRLINKRYTFLDIEDADSPVPIEQIYKTSAGGAVVIRFPAETDSEAAYAMSGGMVLEDVCTLINKYKRDVLTILCFSRDDERSVEAVSEELGNMCFIEIADSALNADRAADYLKFLAEDYKIDADDKLWENIEEKKKYFGNELDSMFEAWYEKKLRSGIYPQYSGLTAGADKGAEDKKMGIAYEELEKMVGLTEAKKVIKKAVNYYKARKFFRENGVKEDSPTMHMVFTGNPGTAKTTVARLFAEIMKDNHVLPVGHLVEVGRSDLVGKYTGHTAPKVKKAFRDARGGVLFIDEAYSLVDDKEGMFGDEAINTIVQEMENNRQDTVVIFAGYPDKMKDFLNRNPGLGSRIAYHIPFDDYDTDELCDIAETMAREKGLSISEEAMPIIREVCETQRREKGFGNGRFVRNLIEQSKINLASRLLEQDTSAIKKSEICTLKGEDIEIPAMSTKCRKTIGFCV